MHHSVRINVIVPNEEGILSRWKPSKSCSDTLMLKFGMRNNVQSSTSRHNNIAWIYVFRIDKKEDPQDVFR